MLDEVRSVLLALVSVEEYGKAEQLQTTFADALSTTIDLIPQVWSAEVVNSSAQVIPISFNANSVREKFTSINFGVLIIVQT